VTTGRRRRPRTHLISDTVVLTRRNLTLYRRDPTLLAFFIVQPILLVVLITYVFGGAIEQSIGVHYIDYFMPGVFVLAIGFARAAVLAGRTASDTIRNALVIVLMIAVGFLAGFRFRAGVLAAVAAIGMTLAIGIALCWISAYVGLVVGGAEAAQLAVLAIIIPLSFASSVFVPVASMPGWLQVIANLNPITQAVDAIRALALGGPTAGPVIRALLWIGAILAVTVPLASARYRRVAAT
jgi:ABC transporter DrrB family efflux protein